MADQGRDGRFLAGNKIQLRHGLYSAGQVPGKAAGVRKRLGQVRRILEQKARGSGGAADGQLTETQRGLIDLVLAHERRRLLAGWWLARQVDADGLAARDLADLLRIEADALQQRLAAEKELLNGAAGRPTLDDDLQRLIDGVRPPFPRLDDAPGNQQSRPSGAILDAANGYCETDVGGLTELAEK
jgi:hypothetical protein